MCNILIEIVVILIKTCQQLDPFVLSLSSNALIDAFSFFLYFLILATAQ